MNVVAIGAHPDDIEIGCGGTLLAHRARGDVVTLVVMTTGERGPQASRSRIQEQHDAARLLDARVYWGNFADGAVPEGRPAVEVIQSVLQEVGADVVYSHVPRDTHQDHRATGLATLAAARRCSRILGYEAPTSIGFGGQVFVDIESTMPGKLDLIRAHASQVLKNGLVDIEAIAAQARHRGFQARVRQAEAFEADRFVWDLEPGAARANRHDRAFDEVTRLLDLEPDESAGAHQSALSAAGNASSSMSHDSQNPALG
jgi:LmbE family N-acetylglucosaminyl deacetylase